MPNVDKCTRWAEVGLCGDAIESAQIITELPNEMRVRVFQGKDAAAIRAMLERWSEEVKAAICARWKLRGAEEIILKPSSDNNREGADLYCEVGGETIEIEIKFGAKTDHAIGMALFGRIFGTQIYSEVANKEQRKVWQKSYRHEYPDGEPQLRRLMAKLNHASKEFDREMEERGWKLTADQQTELETTILNNSGTTAQAKAGQYVAFDLVRGEMKPRATYKTGVGKWIVEPVRQTNIGGERTCIYIHNPLSNIRIKFLYHFKNDHKVDGLPEKAPAKLGLGSPCWNVWIL